MNSDDSQNLTSLLTRYRPELVAFAQREAGVALLRFESADDLVQTIHHEALRSADRFEWRDEKQFLGWVFTIARRCFSSSTGVKGTVAPGCPTKDRST